MTPFAEGQEERIIEAVKEHIDQYLRTGRDVGFGLVASTQDNRDHIAQIGKSILCTRWGVGYPGGSFAQAVVDNDLREAFGRADHINLNCIRFYVSLMYNQTYVV